MDDPALLRESPTIADRPAAAPTPIRRPARTVGGVLPPVATIPAPHPDRARRLAAAGLAPREFRRNRDGMIHAMDGGLWLHFHTWKGRPMAHLVSTDRAALLAYAEAVGFPPGRLQEKPLRDPRTGERREAWHFDLGGPFLPERVSPPEP